MSARSPIVAVLTGDLVKSRQSDPASIERAMQVLGRSAATLTDICDADTRFTRFRGDGWQLVLGSVRVVLRASLLLVADLRANDIGIETRISAGIGHYDSLGTANLSDATGSAFFVSGNHLDAAPKRKRLLVAGGRSRDQNWQAAIFDLVDHQVSSWSRPQAEAVAMALRHGQMTQQDIADQLDITRQAVQLRLATAGYSALETALTAFEHFDWEGL